MAPTQITPMQLDSKDAAEALLREVLHHKAQIHFGIPESHRLIHEHDVVVLESWTVRDLLLLARRGVFQVALLSEDLIDEELFPFFDWQLKDLGDLLSLKEKVLEVNPQMKTDMSAAVGVQADTAPGASGATGSVVSGANPSTAPGPANPSSKKGALFIDRDGVVNIDHGFVGDPQQVELIPHISEMIAHAHRQKKEVVVVTNQSGVGRGYYSEVDFNRVMNRIFELLSFDGVKIDRVEYSPFHPQATLEKFRLNRHLRKPRPGMIHRATSARSIDLSKSMLVGDRYTDLIAGVLAGVGNNFLLASDQVLRDRQKFEDWTSLMKSKHQLSELMDGISFHVLSGLDEFKIHSK